MTSRSGGAGTSRSRTTLQRSSCTLRIHRNGSWARSIRILRRPWSWMSSSPWSWTACAPCSGWGNGLIVCRAGTPRSKVNAMTAVDWGEPAR
eukprot:5777233-Pyramimonas_sp.AAC.1